MTKNQAFVMVSIDNDDFDFMDDTALVRAFKRLQANKMVNSKGSLTGAGKKKLAKAYEVNDNVSI